MRKILSGMTVLTLILSALCTGVLAEAIDVTGEWYARFYGIAMTMTLNEDGIYALTMDMEDEDPTEGTWTFDGTALVLDGGSEAEMTFAYDPEAISFHTEEDGVEFLFTREMPAAFEAAPARADATIEEFAGAWNCTLVDFMGMQAAPDEMELDLSVRIEGYFVTLILPELLGEEASLEGELAGGTLTVTVPAESEYVEDTVFTLQLLEDGTMRVATSVLDELMAFYMSPAEVQE